MRRYTHEIKLRTTETDWRWLQAQAAKESVSVAHVLRSLIREERKLQERLALEHRKQGTKPF